MQNFEILLNNRYTASTQAVTSGLDLVNDYYVYVIRNGGGIVNPYNVRGYLNDQRNQQITNDFFAYLTGSTSQDQALNILSSDKKLADVFNDYYQRIILSSSQISSTAVIQQNLTGSNQINGYTFNHPWNGTAAFTQLTGITQGIDNSVNDIQATVIWDEFTTEQSYFVPVVLERGTNQLSRYKYDICDVFINSKTAGFYPEFSGITESYFGNTSILNVLSNVQENRNSNVGRLNSEIETVDISNQELLSKAETLNSGSLSPGLNSGGLSEAPDLGLVTVSEAVTLGGAGATLNSSLDIDASVASFTADTRIHTILNCFVDINLETNENKETRPKQPKVSFQFNKYAFNEGDNFQIRVDLNAPSQEGIEQATISLSAPTTNSATLIQDYFAAETYPITLSWAAGEQYKFLSFVANTDFLFENTESFLLKISNVINVDAGAVLDTTIDIIDTTVLRKVSLSVKPPAPIQASTIAGVNNCTIFEGDALDLTVTLDGPAFGVESIILKMVQTASTIGGMVGPEANPAIINDDFIISASSVVFNFAPGETQKTLRFSARTDNSIEETKTVLFEIQNPQFCTLDQNQQVVSISIEDTTGAYKFVHLNLGDLYTELGNNGGRTELRRLDLPPLAQGTFGGPESLNLTDFAQTIIKYTDSIFFQSNTLTSGPTTLSYSNDKVKVRIFNAGTIQSIVNNVPVLPGQSVTLGISGNNFVLTATTNSNHNITTNFFDDANYKIQLISDYSGTTQFHPTNNAFTLRAIDNVSEATNNILDIGTYSLSGTTTFPNNTANQYRLKSKYSEAYAGRINTGTFSNPVYSCPVDNPSQFGFSNKVDNVSIFGVMFLNFKDSFPYNNWASTHYEGFEFVQTASTTCAEIMFHSIFGEDFKTIPYELNS